MLKHDCSLYEFYDKCVSEEFSENLNCCSLDIPDRIDQLCQEGIGYEEHDEDELSDFSGEEIEGIEKLFSADDFPRELLSEDIFRNVLKNEITEIFRKVHSSEENKSVKTSSKSWTAYYSEVFKFSTSEKYKQLVEDYLGGKPTSKDYETCKIIFDKVTSSILKDETVCLESSQRKKADSTSDVSISEASHSKIRYIGGACVAKCKFHFMNITRNSLYKNLIKTSTSFAKVKLLDHICSNDDLVSEISNRHSKKTEHFPWTYTYK